MPRPPVPSLITTIGCSAASGAFDFDFNSPRHSARKPGSEFAPPTSTPNSVRWTGRSGTFASASSSALAEATIFGDAATVGIGSADTVFFAFAAPGSGFLDASGSLFFEASGSISFPAAASGGAMIDFAGISGGPT